MLWRCPTIYAQGSQKLRFFGPKIKYISPRAGPWIAFSPAEVKGGLALALKTHVYHNSDPHGFGLWTHGPKFKCTQVDEL